MSWCLVSFVAAAYLVCEQHVCATMCRNEADSTRKSFRCRGLLWLRRARFPAASTREGVFGVLHVCDKRLRQHLSIVQKCFQQLCRRSRVLSYRPSCVRDSFAVRFINISYVLLMSTRALKQGHVVNKPTSGVLLYLLRSV